MSFRSERENVAHLLRRFGLGASESEIDYYAPGGYAAAVDKLLNFQNVVSTADIDPRIFANGNGIVNIRVMQGVWYLRMLVTNRPLEEKMALFWHNHFATSAMKVENSVVMRNHIDTLRQHGLGKFSRLVGAISKDPGMLYWLDNHENVKGKPNENFAREVMELFTLGVGNYTEKDVQEAARAFTGWGYGRPRFGRAPLASDSSPRPFDQFVFSTELHDDGPKEVLGVRGNHNGDDVLNTLCLQAQCSRFIAHKMWEFFAYEKPDDQLIESLAKKFRESNLDISELVRAIMLHPEFLSERSFRKQVKNPIDFVVSSARALGAGAISLGRLKQAEDNPQVNPDNGLNRMAAQALGPAIALWNSSKAMGMELMYPPDVSGWKGGPAWISTSAMVERIKWADKLFGAQTRPQPGNPQARNPVVGVRAWELIQTDPTPRGVVATLAGIFDAPLDDKTRTTLHEVAISEADGAISQLNANRVAAAVTRTLFASPPFQFA